MEVFGIVLSVIFGLVVYFLPSMIGSGKRNGCAIFALNLFLGWTLIGWVIALVWACCKDITVETKIINQVENQKGKEDKYDKLEKLANLKEKGLITEEEFIT